MKKIMSKKNIGFLLGLGMAVGTMAPGVASAGDFDCTLGCGPGFALPTQNVNGGLFTTETFNPAGTGYIAPFIRLSDKGAWDPDKQKFQPPPDGLESGANGGNALEEKDTFVHNWNRILQVDSGMIFNQGGTDYMMFLLDANEVASPTGQYIDLTNLRLYIGPDGTTNEYAHASDPTDDTYLVWGMNENGDHDVLLDYDLLSGGSGWGDLKVLIPLGATGAGAGYVGKNFFLYSDFGMAENLVDDGFEEWTVAGTGGTPPPDVIPEPATMLLFGTGLAALAGARRRMNKQ